MAQKGSLKKVFFLIFGSDLTHPPQESGKNILENRPCQQHCTSCQPHCKLCQPHYCISCQQHFYTTCRPYLMRCWLHCMSSQTNHTFSGTPWWGHCISNTGTVLPLVSRTPSHVSHIGCCVCCTPAHHVGHTAAYYGSHTTHLAELQGRGDST